VRLGLEGNMYIYKGCFAAFLVLENDGFVVSFFGDVELVGIGVGTASISLVNWGCWLVFVACTFDRIERTKFFGCEALFVVCLCI